MLAVTVAGRFQHFQIFRSDVLNKKRKIYILAEASALLESKKGVVKARPITSIFCAAISLAARILSRPPEKRAIALGMSLKPIR